ncbi:MAG: rhodanese-like domain-containing protein [Desulfobacterales bacterium]
MKQAVTIKPRSIPLKQALWQLPAIIMLAVLIGIGFNQLGSNGIPIIGDWSVETRFSDISGQPLVMDLEQAVQLFEQNEALFVDARPENLYFQGHIRGALSLPLEEVNRYFAEVADKLDVSKPIITYCDGETCDLSHELTLFLKEMGFEDVHVLVNGWTVWQQAGLPTEAGE